MLEEFVWMAERDSDGVALNRSGDDSLSELIPDGLLSEGVEYVALEAALLGVILNISLLLTVFEGRGWKMSGVPLKTFWKGSYCLEGVGPNGSSRLETSWNKSLVIGLGNGSNVFVDDGENTSRSFIEELFGLTGPLSVGTA